MPQLIVTYRIVELLDPRRPGERWFEVWSGNLATGYQWRMATFNNSEEAREFLNSKCGQEEQA